jgi:hypothetical protein
MLLDSSGECGVPVYQRFASPENGNSVFWFIFHEVLDQFVHVRHRYSFDVASMHVIQFSTGAVSPQNDTRLIALRARLASRLCAVRVAAAGSRQCEPHTNTMGMSAA